MSRQMGTCSTSAVSDGQDEAQIIVDWDECEANAVCESILPEIFQVDENDMLNVLNDRPPAYLLGKVQEAVDMCPKRALVRKRAGQGRLRFSRRSPAPPSRSATTSGLSRSPRAGSGSRSAQPAFATPICRR